MTVVHRTYQFRAYTAKQGYQDLLGVMNSLGYLYNEALEGRKLAYDVKQGEELPDAPDLDGTADGFLPQSYLAREYLVGDTERKQASGLKPLCDAHPRYAALDRHICRSPLEKVNTSMRAFFRRVKAGETPGYPRFKPSARYRTISTRTVAPAWVKTKENGNLVITIKGLPRLECRVKRDLPERDAMKAIRITKNPGRRVTVSIVYDVGVAELPQTNSPVGLDKGVSSRVALSTGEHIEGLKPDRRKTKRLQRQLARSQEAAKGRAGLRGALPKGTRVAKSRTWHKRRDALSNAQQRDQVRRRNETHRLTTDLIRRFDFIAVEALEIPNMVRSAKGTAEEPGSGVAQKRGLNRSIQEQTWGILHDQLDYKAESAGRRFVKVPPQYTSQDCSRCGARNPGRTPKRLYRCQTCGLERDRDWNAASNILALGLAQAGVETKAWRSAECWQPALMPEYTQKSTHSRRNHRGRLAREAS